MPPRVPLPPPLLTPKEVADRLGVSKDHVYRLITAGELPAVNIAVNPRTSRPELRIREAAVQDFLNRRPAAPQPPPPPLSRRRRQPQLPMEPIVGPRK